MCLSVEQNALYQANTYKYWLEISYCGNLIKWVDRDISQYLLIVNFYANLQGKWLMSQSLSV
jgi:hypothetical protein